MAGYEWLSREVEAFPSRVRTQGDVAKLVKEPCSANESVFMGAWEGDINFIYLYKTLFQDLGITPSFDAFKVDVLNVLNVAPTHLYPNGWAAMQAFWVICHFLHMEPTAAKFLHHYAMRLYQKYGCVSLTELIGKFNFKSLRAKQAKKKKSFEVVLDNQEVATSLTLLTPITETTILDKDFLPQGMIRPNFLSDKDRKMMRTAGPIAVMEVVFVFEAQSWSWGKEFKHSYN
ncbi:hypothetical protein CR513_58192, partial [Mucuna pruriens]